MNRPRYISRAILRRPELEGVSLEAENLALRLPLACDDSGRARLDYLPLTEQLFPNHPEAYYNIAVWYGELAKAGFVRHDSVAQTTYLQLVGWNRDQHVDDPAPGGMPSPCTDAAPAGPVAEVPVDAAQQSAESSVDPVPADPTSGRSPSSQAEVASPSPTGAPATDAAGEATDSLDEHLARLWTLGPDAR